MAFSQEEQTAFDKLKADWTAIGNDLNEVKVLNQQIQEAAAREDRGFAEVLMERAIGRPLTLTEKFAYLCGRVQGEKVNE